ncbi:MAG: LON peptidase substrate-binding domain-containing protein [Acidiferrobacterales bacterium]
MNELPLFLLKTVLFPGGRLGLRVFEKRYLDMISACMKAERPFGVCLIRSGQEVGEAAQPHPFGTIGHIIEWDMAQAGILQICVRGGRRFGVTDTRVCADQLIVADVEFAPEEPEVELSGDHSYLKELLAKILEQVGEQYYFPPAKLDDAVWIAYRLTELLPMPDTFKQQVLEQPDVTRRLDMLAGAIDAACDDET